MPPPDGHLFSILRVAFIEPVRNYILQVSNMY